MPIMIARLPVAAIRSTSSGVAANSHRSGYIAVARRRIAEIAPHRLMGAAVTLGVAGLLPNVGGQEDPVDVPGVYLHQIALQPRMVDAGVELRRRILGPAMLDMGIQRQWASVDLPVWADSGSSAAGWRTGGPVYRPPIKPAPTPCRRIMATLRKKKGTFYFSQYGSCGSLVGCQTLRASQGGYVYHVINRGNAQNKVFRKPDDYRRSSN